MTVTTQEISMVIIASHLRFANTKSLPRVKFQELLS
jgi:hypothetical protein